MVDLDPVRVEPGGGELALAILALEPAALVGADVMADFEGAGDRWSARTPWSGRAPPHRRRAARPRSPARARRTRGTRRSSARAFRLPTAGASRAGRIALRRIELEQRGFIAAAVVGPDVDAQLRHLRLDRVDQVLRPETARRRARPEVPGLRRSPLARQAAGRRSRGSRRERRAHAATAGSIRGLRITAGWPLNAARIRSGTSRSSAQSPPPITLPARTVAIARRPSPKEAFVVRPGHQLGAGLGRAVRVGAAELVVLAIGRGRSRHCDRPCRSSR